MGTALDDAARLAALAATALFDAARVPAFDRLAAAAAAVLEAPIAAVSLLDASHHHFAGCVGLPDAVAGRPIPLSHSVCRHTVASSAPLVIADARVHPVLRKSGAVTELGVVAYLGVPLVTAAGHVLGSFCVIDRRPRAWSAADVAMLEALAVAAVTELDLRAALAARDGVLEEIPEGLVVLDAARRLTFVNRRAAVALGRPATDALGRAFTDAYPQLRGTAFDEASATAASTRAPAIAEATAPIGEQWYAVTAVPAPDGGVSVYFRDVSARRRADEALRAQHALLSAVMEGTTDALWVKDADGRYRMINGAGARMLGRTVEGVAGRTDDELFDAASAAAIALRDRAVLADGSTHTEDTASTAADGSARAYVTTRAPLRDAAGAVVGVIGVSRDVTTRAREEAAVRTSEERLRLAMDAARLSVWERELGAPAPSGVQSGAPGAAWAIAEARLLDGVHPDDCERVAAVARRAYASFGTFDVEYRVGAAGGTVAWRQTAGRVYAGTADRPARMAGVDVDVTERKVLEEQLAYQAFHDPLTGLANRALFRDRAEHAMARAGRGAAREHVAVLFLDLDDFKAVDDSLGHGEGDRLLAAVAARLLRATRGCDTVARFGGDEFAVLLDDMAGPGDAPAVAARVVAALAAPVRLDGREVQVSASIGVAHAHADDSVSDLLRNADVAMYQAKAAGSGRTRVFEPAMHAAAVDRLTLAEDLRHAVARDQLRLRYQPIVELATGRTAGVEALVRWQHPTRGLVQPADFIPLAEETGLIVELGAWVLTEACAQLARWDRDAADYGDAAAAGTAAAAAFTMSINLSGRQLEDADVVAHVARAIDAAGIAPARVRLEITESVVMRHADEALGRLRALKALGVQLAIDDFGTGYSSLAYLQRFPVDVLKIDRAFVDPIGGGPDAAALVRAIVALGDTLRLATVAEGIEREEQRAALAALGCEFGQGYLFAEPLTPDEVMRRPLATATR